MESLFQDLRYAVRTWTKRPGFAAVVVTTLALGIGANTAIFSVINSVLLRPLPYPRPSELCVLRTSLPEQGLKRPASSAPELNDFRTQSSSFSVLGGIWNRPGALTDDAMEPEEIDMGFVSAGFLDAIGVNPVLGRFILTEEDVQNGPRVIVLSHDLWNRRYGADDGIIGKRIGLDGQPHTVVGVMPPDYRMLLPPDAGVPSHLDAWVPWGGGYEEYPRTWRILTVVGRLEDGVLTAGASAEMKTIARRLRDAYPEAYEGSGIDIEVEGLHRDVVAHVQPMLVALLGAVGFVLLIACANVANLFLVRATSMEREMAIRTALGARHWRLLRQLMAESAVVCFAGVVLGLVFAQWGLDALLLLEPGELPRLEDISLDGTALGFALLAGVLTSLVFGSVTLFHVSKFGQGSALHAGSRTSGDSQHYRMRGLIVIAELALSLMLLIGAGLLARSFVSMAAVDPGFNASSILTMKLSLVDSHYPYREPNKIAQFYRDLTQRLEELAGVEAVGATTRLPMDGHARTAPYAYETVEGVVEWESVAADYRTVTPGWLEAMGARLKAGRFFEWTDDLEHPNVVIIDDMLAESVWPGLDPVGQRLQVEIFLNGEWQPVWSEVVGVVEHLWHHSARRGIEQILLPHQQSPQRTMALAIRSDVDERKLADAVRREVLTLNAVQPVHGVRPMEAYLAESMASTRFTLVTLACFAVMALVLAAVGIYGVIAYTVSRRTQEIGVRLALGATPRKILETFLRQAVLLTSVGLALGWVGAFAMTRYLSSLLHGVTATDTATFAWVSLFLAVIAVVACYIPARRAAKLDPSLALRDE